MNILERIAGATAARLKQTGRAMTAAELKKRLGETPARPGFASALNRQGVNVIAELKKASPSRGLIRADFQVAALARELEEAGAAALSVLTEPDFFLGAPENLKAAAAAVELPLLCKDFIIDVRQIYEAKLSGASAVLLIAALLSQNELLDLAEAARKLGLDVLGEVHTHEELDRMLDSPVGIIGVNARDLRSFDCSLERAAELLSRIPGDRIAVAESAIRNRDDMLYLAGAGARAFLIGETLMRASSPGGALRELMT